MTPFGLPCSCLQCGGELGLVNTAATSGNLSIAILACDACRKEWEVSMRMTRHHAPETKPAIGQHARPGGSPLTLRG